MTDLFEVSDIRQAHSSGHSSTLFTPTPDSYKMAPRSDRSSEDDLAVLIETLEETEPKNIEESFGDPATTVKSSTASANWLQTDVTYGLTSPADVDARRKEFGLNQLKKEKENMVKTFAGYFIGRIQLVMVVKSSLIPGISLSLGTVSLN